MDTRFSLRTVKLIIGILISSAAFWLIAASSIAASAQSIAAPNIDCGVISCTVYLPIIFKAPPLSAAQFEVTQAVQQPDNSVLLAANRTTYVRWTLTSAGANANVSAYLYGTTANGTPLPGSPIAALNNSRTLKATANRAVLNDTFNFKLPDTWSTGSILLSAYAGNSAGYNVNTVAVPFQFISADSMRVTIIPIHYKCNNQSGSYQPAPPFGYLTDYTYRLYPVPSIITSIHSAANYSGACSGTGPTPSLADWENMLNVITTIWDNAGNPNNYYYGLLSIDCSGGCIAGIGWIGGNKAAVGFSGFGSAHTAASETHAHEVGHNHGRRHTPGCGPAGVDPLYPYTGGAIGNSSHQNFGFDIVTLQIYPYASPTAYDIMDYCDNQWVSDYTYNGLYSFANLNLNLASSQPLGDRALLISGSIDPSSGRAAIRSAYTLDVPARLPDHGDHTLELLDANGNIIATYSFAPTRAEIDRYPLSAGGELIGFNLKVPYANNVAAIRVRHGSTILGELRSGAHAPVLSTQASTLNAATQTTRINWLAADPDREPLHYLVRASIDNGANWQTIGVDLAQPQIDLDPDYFSGHLVLVQVLASDGLHTSQLNLGPYIIP
jgi:hypothetical protein